MREGSLAGWRRMKVHHSQACYREAEFWCASLACLPYETGRFRFFCGLNKHQSSGVIIIYVQATGFTTIIVTTT